MDILTFAAAPNTSDWDSDDSQSIGSNTSDTPTNLSTAVHAPITPVPASDPQLSLRYFIFAYYAYTVVFGLLVIVVILSLINFIYLFLHPESQLKLTTAQRIGLHAAIITTILQVCAFIMYCIFLKLWRKHYPTSGTSRPNFNFKKHVIALELIVEALVLFLGFVNAYSLSI